MLLSMEGMSTLHLVLFIANAIFRTTGGSGGTQTTVTTLDALTAAVTGDAKKVVIISGMLLASEDLKGLLTHPLLGTITGSAVVRVGSNTSVIGKSGSGKSYPRLFLI